MKKEDLWDIYDHTYAKDYNERYLSNPFSKVSSDTELNVLKGQINASTRWLDLGCGTGYFLSQFPGIQRAGVDISPEMIKLASDSNPDAMFIMEGDFRKEHAEWSGAWTLTTCMWGAYCYVDSVREVEQVVRNMISWTKTGGSVFLPVVDIEDVRPNMKTSYEEPTGVFGGRISVTAITWTWQEENGKIHEHLVSPHIEHIINLLKPFFNRIEIIRYPPYMANWVSRKAILATGRQDIENAGQHANILWHEIPQAAIKPQKKNQYISIFKSLAKKLYGKILRK